MVVTGVGWMERSYGGYCGEGWIERSYGGYCDVG